MMKKILFYPLFLLKVVLKNPVKLTALIICILCIYLPNWRGDTYKSLIVSDVIFNDPDYNEGYVHLIVIKSDVTHRYELRNTKNPTIEEEGVHSYLLHRDASELNILWGVLVILGGVTFLLSPIERQGRWQFKDILNELYMKEIEMDKDKTDTYYHFRGKLILKVPRNDYYGDSIPKGEIEDNLDLYRKTPNIFEDYEGGEQRRRNDKLNNLINEDA